MSMVSPSTRFSMGRAWNVRYPSSWYSELKSNPFGSMNTRVSKRSKLNTSPRWMSSKLSNWVVRYLVFPVNVMSPK